MRIDRVCRSGIRSFPDWIDAHNKEEEMMKIRNFAAFAMILVVVACAPAGSKPSPDLAAAAEKWQAALNSGDIEAIAALYTADAGLLPPNAEMQKGHDAVRASFGEMIAAGMKAKLDTTEAFESGDMGYRLGTYVLTAPDGAVVDRGKYIETWKNEGGAWKISNDIWNSDLPPPPPAGTTMVITHEVKDADHWLAAWTGDNSREKMFAQHGVTSARKFQNVDKPNTVALIFQVADMDAFQAALASPETEKAKAEDGVKNKTLMAFAEVK
jgi:ketosteroid isomerase-like protein